MRYYLILIILFLSDAQASLGTEVGDLLFSKIRGCPHVAILIRDGIVVETNPKDGVREVTFDRFVIGCDSDIAVARVIDQRFDFKRMQSFVSETIGAKYNPGFVWECNEYYCSQHVALAINAGLGEEVIRPKPMKFKEEFWDLYFYTIEMIKPVDEPGVHPQSIWDHPVVQQIVEGEGYPFSKSAE